MLRLFAADAWLSAVSSRHRRHSQSRPSCGILQLFQVYDALSSLSCSGSVAAFVEVGIGTATALIRNKARSRHEVVKPEAGKGHTDL